MNFLVKFEQTYPSASNIIIITSKMMHDDDTMMIKNESIWMQSDDKKLFTQLSEFSAKMSVRIQDIEKKMEELEHDFEQVSIDIQNVNNRFGLIGNTQFIERRVYEDDDDVILEPQNQDNGSFRNERPQETKNKIDPNRAIANGMKALQCTVNVDCELPPIIGTRNFLQESGTSRRNKKNVVAVVEESSTAYTSTSVAEPKPESALQHAAVKPRVTLPMSLLDEIREQNADQRIATSSEASASKPTEIVAPPPQPPPAPQARVERKPPPIPIREEKHIEQVATSQLDTNTELPEEAPKMSPKDDFKNQLARMLAGGAVPPKPKPKTVITEEESLISQETVSSQNRDLLKAIASRNEPINPNRVNEASTISEDLIGSLDDATSDLKTQAPVSMTSAKNVIPPFGASNDAAVDPLRLSDSNSKSRSSNYTSLFDSSSDEEEQGLRSSKKLTSEIEGSNMISSDSFAKNARESSMKTSHMSSNIARPPFTSLFADDSDDSDHDIFSRSRNMVPRNPPRITSKKGLFDSDDDDDDE